ncbi:DUF4249 family protein, partial [Flavihumibacter sp. CACIAM 22H1]|uniref:DUF4249 family protein n=1 Tax=Flavihumibacter sp. CACIAM 22H1 TaxID=1812911 RepID=UPI0025C6D39B
MREGLVYSILLLLLNLACRKPYIAPIQKKLNQYLVVDGIINASPQGVTRINLSYTKNIDDTARQVPLNDARVQIESTDGSIYELVLSNDSGLYVSSPLSLSSSNSYRLLIQTGEQKSYRSAFTEVLAAPEIDDISWMETPDLELFVSTKDPSNELKYYRWQYEETWQTRAQTPSFWTVVDGKIVEANEFTQTANCWVTQSSTSILIGNTLSLSSAIINKAPLVRIPKPDKRLSIRYSFLLHQFAISAEAYQ